MKMNITIITTVITKGDSTQYPGWPFTKCFVTIARASKQARWPFPKHSAPRCLPDTHGTEWGAEAEVEGHKHTHSILEHPPFLCLHSHSHVLSTMHDQWDFWSYGMHPLLVDDPPVPPPSPPQPPHTDAKKPLFLASSAAALPPPLRPPTEIKQRATAESRERTPRCLSQHRNIFLCF